MQPNEIDKLTTRLLDWHDQLPWADDLGRIAAPALTELAAGQPVDVELLAARAGMTAASASALLCDSPAEFDDDGRLIGLGLTLRPTPHQVELQGRILFTWCAGDTLMLPGLLGIPARVQSPCFATGEVVKVDVDPDGVRTVDPKSAVVSMVTPDVGLAEFRRHLCDQQHFFASPEAAAAWRTERPQAILVPVRDAFEVSGALAQRWFAPSAAQERGA